MQLNNFTIASFSSSYKNSTAQTTAEKLGLKTWAKDTPYKLLRQRFSYSFSRSGHAMTSLTHGTESTEYEIGGLYSCIGLKCAHGAFGDLASYDSPPTPRYL